jgi:amino acid transporter
MSLHGTDEDTKILHEMGYAQELSRRMGPFQSFAISFSIICIISGGFGSFPIALSTGGPFSLTIGWLIGGAYALIVAMALGQIASSYPTAGSLYHWASILGGRAVGWVTAYINLLGLFFVIPAVNVFLYLVSKDLFFGAWLGWDISGWGTWTQIWSVAGITAAQCLLNHFGIRLTTLLTDFSGYLILVVTVILIVMFIMAAPNFDTAKLFALVNNTGDAGGGVAPAQSSILMAILLGMLYPLFTITGFDASAHTAEETVDARNTVHRGMIHSVVWSIVFGFVLICAMLFAIPDTAAAAKSGWSSFNNLFIAAILPSALGKLMLIGVIIANFCCALSAVTSTSRMIYAFARDGGMPKVLASVSPSSRSPVAAIWFTGIVAVVLTAVTTPLGAFAALSTGCAMYLYVSYAMPIIAGFFAEGKTWTSYGSFRLGALSKVFSVIVMIGTVLIIIAGHVFVPSIATEAVPAVPAVAATATQAAVPAVEAVAATFVPGLWYYSVGYLIFLAVMWFGFESRRFKGPPVGDEIKRRQAEIAAQERALGGAG